MEIQGIKHEYRECSKGHFAKRYANGQCGECKRIANKERAEKAGGWHKNLRKPTGVRQKHEPGLEPHNVELYLQLMDKASQLPHWQRAPYLEQAQKLLRKRL